METEDCLFRLFMLAVVNAVFIGGSVHVINDFFYGSWKPHSRGDIIGNAVMLASWFSFVAFFYPMCWLGLFPWFLLGRCGLPLQCVLFWWSRGVGWLFCWPCLLNAATEDDAANDSPEHVAQRRDPETNELPREPPRRGRVPHHDITLQEQQDDASECAVCLTEVENAEVATQQLPACLHVFHRQCIHLWLRDISTCPVYRCNVIAPQPMQMV